jgi:putative transposase
MPRRVRSTPRSRYFHVTNRSAGRLVLFAQPADYRAFLSILSQGLERYPVRLIAYSLMPDHWHLVVGPTDTSALSRCLHWVTATHAVRLNTRASMTERQVYQGRFSAVEIAAVADLVRMCRSVERSALRARLVRRAQDWPWASLGERLQPLQEVPLVNTPFLSSRAWVDYVNAMRSDEDSPAPGLRSRTTLGDIAEPPGRLA